MSTIDRVGGPFDLIVVDGRARNDAFRRSLDHLADGGVIVFDNLKRKRYWDVISAHARPAVRAAQGRDADAAVPHDHRPDLA